MFLLDDLFLLPWRGLFFIFKEIAKRAEAELNDPDTIRARLRELQFRYEAGDLEEGAYQAAFSQLVARLRTLQEEAEEEEKGELKKE